MQNCLCKALCVIHVTNPANIQLGNNLQWRKLRTLSIQHQANQVVKVAVFPQVHSVQGLPEEDPLSVAGTFLLCAHSFGRRRTAP
eukprot:4494665-Karenia_brevis.AAC.1